VLGLPSVTAAMFNSLYIKSVRHGSFGLLRARSFVIALSSPFLACLLSEKGFIVSCESVCMDGDVCFGRRCEDTGRKSKVKYMKST